MAMKMAKEEMAMKKMTVMGDGMAKHTPPPGMKESKDMPMHNPSRDRMIQQCMKECGMGKGHEEEA